MDVPKLKVSPKKYSSETVVASMRIPKDMLQEIDYVAAETGRTRNELLLLSLEFALEHMEITSERPEKRRK